MATNKIQKLKWLSLFWMLFFSLPGHTQTTPQKEINQQLQFWTSINTVTRFTERWGMLADFHIRRNNFIADPSFYFLRGAANYWIQDNMTVSLGYAHMWLAPSRSDWHTFSNEDRVYQQFQVISKIRRSVILQRLRNELRWQQKIIDDKKTNEYRFTDRIRYLFNYNYSFFKNSYLPSLVIADEILIHFGKEVVYNTFDQNRLFLGIKQNISPSLSFDFGYMNVYQQKYSGYQYDMNHTIRLFFYLNVGWKRNATPPASGIGEE